MCIHFFVGRAMMKYLFFILPIVGCFDPQPQYIDSKNSSEEESSDTESGISPVDSSPDSENEDTDNTDNSDDSNTDNSNTDNSNTEPSSESENPEPSFEQEIPVYTGGYNVNLCSSEPQATGYGVGQVAGDFTLVDQFGETVRLSDFCGNAVLLVAATFW